MKAIVTLTAGLILVSATFGQTSRRSESKDENTQNTNKRSEVSTERRTPTDNSRTETSSTNRRNTDTQTSERRSEVHSPAAPSVPDNQDRSSVSNRRGSENQSSERRTEVSNNTPSTNTQDRSSITNRRNPSEQNNGYSNQGNSSIRTYDNNRPQQSRTVRDQVIVQEQARRTVEPRHHTIVHNSYRPVPVEVRRNKYPYRTPVRGEIIWTVDLSRRYEVYYPAYRPYRYHYGMRIATVSAYDAFDFVGDLARVYGRVAETYYSWDTDEYFLYIGDYYPYQDFSVIIPGREARDFSRHPERFFDREYIEVTGLITRFEGKPEMVIKNSSQINVY